MSIASKLEYLDGTKDYIRQCIQQKGVTVPSNTTFREYGNKILEIDTEKHPDGWEGGDGGEVNLEVGTALATGQDFTLSPSEGYDGFSSVNVLGDVNLKPENIADGITIYGVTGTMEVPRNMTTIPPAYQDLFEEARTYYDGDYENLMILESDEAVAFGFMLNGFNVESYDDNNTEFTASRWVYVAYNKKTKQWKVESWEEGISNGNSYVKNIRYCDCYIYYGTRQIYPFVFIPNNFEKYECEFDVICLTYEGTIYTSGYKITVVSIGSVDVYENGVFYETINNESSYGEVRRIVNNTSLNGKTYRIKLVGHIRYIGDATNITKMYTPLPPSVNLMVYNKLGTFKNYRGETIPNDVFVNINDNEDSIDDISTLFAITNLITLPTGILDKFVHAVIANDVFSYNYHLRYIPEDLLYRLQKVENIHHMFAGCTMLTEISSNLFSKCKEIITAFSVFRGCTALTKIPEGIFVNCKKITSISELFWGSGLIKTPSVVLSKDHEKQVAMSHMFRECTALTTITSEFFDNIPNTVNNISSMFRDCSNVKGTIPDIWNTSKWGTKFTSIPHDYCFYGCSSASNYSSVPSDFR